MEDKIIEILKAHQPFEGYHISAVWPESFPNKPAIIVENPNINREHPDVEGDVDAKTFQIYLYVITREPSTANEIEGEIEKLFMNEIITIDDKEYFSTIEGTANGIDYEDGKLLFRKQIEINLEGEVVK